MKRGISGSAKRVAVVGAGVRYVNWTLHCSEFYLYAFLEVFKCLNLLIRVAYAFLELNFVTLHWLRHV